MFSPPTRATTFEDVVEFALQELRLLGKQPIELRPTPYLVSHGLTHADAERAYSALKRTGIINIHKTGRGAQPPIVQVSADGSYKEARLKQRLSRCVGRELTISEATELDLMNQIEQKTNELAELQRELARVRANGKSPLLNTSQM